MKKYDPTVVRSTYGTFAEMTEYKYGDYVRYEDMKNLIKSFIDQVGITVDPNILAEELIKDWE